VLADKSEIEVRKSEIEARKSEVEAHKSGVEARKSEIEARRSGVEARKSEIEARKWGASGTVAWASLHLCNPRCTGSRICLVSERWNDYWKLCSHGKLKSILTTTRGIKFMNNMNERCMRMYCVRMCIYKV